MTINLSSLADGAAIDYLVFSANNAVQIYLNGSLLATLDPRSFGQGNSAAYGSLHTIALS